MCTITWGPTRVSVAELDSLVEALRARSAELEATGDQLLRRMATLHESWIGDAASAHAEDHVAWDAALRRLHRSLRGLQAVVRHAHDSYAAAADAGVRMWRQV
jgi:WXG100 family type VII secretion target